MPALEYHLEVEAPAELIFAWLSRPAAWARLLPPWERLRVREAVPPGAEPGRLALEVRRGLRHVPWVTEMRLAGGRVLEETQLQGPFARWTHRREVREVGDGAAAVDGRLEYELPPGSLARLSGEHAVQERLRRVLRYQRDLLRHDLPLLTHFSLHRPLRVGVTGASGLIGSDLCIFLEAGGHRVQRLVRRAPGEGEAFWNPARGEIDAAALEGLDAVVHLAGANLGERRWTRARKRELRDSRVEGTRLLAQTLAGLRQPPAVLLCASAIGYYGPRGEELLPESSPPGRGFLSELVRDWEAASAPAEEAGIRVAHLRMGAVLTPAGGMLGRMLPLFNLGLGGTLGSGSQWLSWVSREDVLGAAYHLLHTPALAGPVNVVAPQAVTNREFTRALARVLHRPAALRVPARALRAAFGEMAAAMLLSGARAVPRRLLDYGYEFCHAALEQALRHILGRQEG